MFAYVAAKRRTFVRVACTYDVDRGESCHSSAGPRGLRSRSPRLSTISRRRIGILAPAALYEHAIARREGRLAKDGPLVVITGQHTGRSPGDKFIVKDAETEGRVWWDNNKAMTRKSAEVLRADMLAYAEGHELLRQGSLRQRRSALLPARAVSSRNSLGTRCSPINC